MLAMNELGSPETLTRMTGSAIVHRPALQFVESSTSNKVVDFVTAAGENARFSRLQDQTQICGAQQFERALS